MCPGARRLNDEYTGWVKASGLGTAPGWEGGRKRKLGYGGFVVRPMNQEIVNMSPDFHCRFTIRSEELKPITEVLVNPFHHGRFV